MKFKDFEGSPEEINNFFQNNGLNVTEYLNITKDRKVDRRWIFLLTALFLIFNIIICLIETNNKFYIPLTIVTLGALGGLIAIIQHNYEKSIVSLIVGVVGLLIMVISYKILSPKETIEKVKDKSEKYLDNKSEKPKE